MHTITQWAQLTTQYNGEKTEVLIPLFGGQAGGYTRCFVVETGSVRLSISVPLKVIGRKYTTQDCTSTGTDPIDYEGSYPATAFTGTYYGIMYNVDPLSD
jgi:hypothetical protein